MNATISLNDEKTKALLTEVMIELIQTRRDLFREVIEDALENVGLANAIMEGRKNDFVSADEVFSILDGAK